MSTLDKQVRAVPLPTLATRFTHNHASTGQSRLTATKLASQAIDAAYTALPDETPPRKGAKLVRQQRQTVLACATPPRLRELTGQERLDEFKWRQQKLLSIPGAKEVEAYDLICFGIKESNLVPKEAAAQLCHRQNLKFSIQQYFVPYPNGTTIILAFSSQHTVKPTFLSEGKNYKLRGALYLCAYAAYSRTAIPQPGREAVRRFQPFLGEYDGFGVIDPYHGHIQLLTKDLPREERPAWNSDPILVAYLRHPYRHPDDKTPIIHFIELCRW